MRKLGVLLKGEGPSVYVLDFLTTGLPVTVTQYGRTPDLLLVSRFPRPFTDPISNVIDVSLRSPVSSTVVTVYVLDERVDGTNTCLYDV